MKARDIRAMLQGNADPKLIQCICALAETVSAQQEEINQLAEIQNKTIDLTMQLGTSMETAVDSVESINKIRGDG
tara:strand:+ start:232 stop:456 length:225 start_codon:yes stop_codon:yes gene_type:complete